METFCFTSLLRLGHLLITSVAHELEIQRGENDTEQQTNFTTAMTSIAILKWNKINNRDKYMCALVFIFPPNRGCIQKHPPIKLYRLWPMKDNAE